MVGNDYAVLYRIGIYILNLHKTWEKLMMAARVIVAIDNPKDVCGVSGRIWGQRAVLKFAKVTTDWMSNIRLVEAQAGGELFLW